MSGPWERYASTSATGPWTKFQASAPAPSPPLGDTLLEPVRGINKGLANLISIPYRAVDWAGEKVTGGDFLTDFDKLPFWGAHANPPKPSDATGRLLQGAGEGVGGALLPMAGMVARAPSLLRAAPPQNVGQSIVQEMARPYAAAPTAAARSDVIAATGAGLGSAVAREAEAGPVGELVGGIVGGLTPFAASTAYQRGAQGLKESAARQGPTGGYAHVAERVDGGVDQFADRVATGATRRNLDAQRQTFDILGEEMQRARGDATVATQATVARLMREADLTRDAAVDRVRRLSSVHQDSPLFLGEYDAVANANAVNRTARDAGNVDLADASRINSARTQDLIDYTANTGGTAAAQATRNAVEERQTEMRQYLRSSLERMAPQNVRTLDDAEHLLETARTRARDAYRSAYHGPQNEPRLVAGLNVAMRNATQRLGSRGGEHARLITEVIEEFQPIVAAAGANQPAVRGTITNLQAAQDARATIRGRIEAAHRAGRTDIAHTLQPIYDDVTRALSYASPSWARANRMWGDLRSGESALEFGQRFVERSSIDQRRAFREFDRMAPEAQDLVRVGWLQRQFDKMAELRDTHDVSKLFDKDGMYRQVEQFFGRPSMLQFARSVRDAEVANRSTGMLKNSATHRRGQMQQQMDIDPGIGAAESLLSIRAAREWLVRKMLDVLKSRRDDAIADVITTPMQHMPQVAGHVHRMREAEQRMHVLRQRPAIMTPTIGPVFGNFEIERNPAPNNALAGR